MSSLAGGPAPADRLNAAEGFAAVLLGAVAADGSVSQSEAIALAQALSSTSMFLGMPESQMRGVLTRVKELYKRRGLEALLAAGAEALPADLRDTAYANCVNLVMADDEVAPAELAYLKRAQAALRVSDATALKVLEVVTILNRG